MKGIDDIIPVTSNWVVSGWQFSQSSGNGPALLKSSMEHSLIDSEGAGPMCDIRSLAIDCGEVEGDDCIQGIWAIGALWVYSCVDQISGGSNGVMFSSNPSPVGTSKSSEQAWEAIHVLDISPIARGSWYKFDSGVGGVSWREVGMPLYSIGGVYTFMSWIRGLE
jgi:hypothetical protein